MSAYILSFIGFLSGIILLFKLRPSHSKTSTHHQKISIIIPARNESLRLPFLLESLQKCPHEVIVVDDESEDDTASIATSYGAKVIQPETRPQGVKGKPWALLCGVKHAQHDIVLLLDADTIIQPGGLDKILSIYLETETPLSIQPYHHMKKSYERLSVLFNLVVVMASNTFQLFNKKQKISAFFGPTQMMKKQEFIHYASKKDVNTKVLDDIELGKSILNDHIQIRSMIGQGIVSFRMYPEGILAVLKGFGKNFATGAIAINVWVTIWISLWLSGIYATINAMIQGIIYGEFIYAIILYVLHGLFLYMTSRQIGNFKISLVLLFPIHALFFLFTFIYSFFTIYILKTNQWKGRQV